MSSPAYYIRSSTDLNRLYEVALNPHGFWECECKDARFRKDRPCKHAEQVRRGCGLKASPKPAPAPVLPDATVDDLFTDGGAALDRALASRR